MGKKKASDAELNFIFSQNLSPICATLPWFGALPEGVKGQNNSLDRGGSCIDLVAIISYDPDQEETADARMLGVKVIDLDEDVVKEDLTRFSRDEQSREPFPRGLYQKVNSKFSNTHYRPMSDAFLFLHLEIVRLLACRIEQLERAGR